MLDIDWKAIIDGLREHAGTGIWFYVGLLWFVWGAGGVALLPFLWVLRLAGFEVDEVLAVTVFMLWGGGWFAYGLILSVIITEVNYRKDQKAERQAENKP
jgi:hypothetical protein